jgi:hypothetical protein
MASFCTGTFGLEAAHHNATIVLILALKTSVYPLNFTLSSTLQGQVTLASIMQLDHGAQMDVEQRELETGIDFALTQAWDR